MLKALQQLIYNTALNLRLLTKEIYNKIKDKKNDKLGCWTKSAKYHNKKHTKHNFYVPTQQFPYKISGNIYHLILDLSSILHDTFDFH